jgi:hypothetical protein
MIGGKLNLFRPPHVNENIANKVKCYLENAKKDNDDGNNNDLDRKLLDKENARLRHDIAKLWLLDMPLQDKSKQILKMMKEELLNQALTSNQREILYDDHDRQLDDHLQRNKNKYMEIHREEYDNIPTTLKFYSNVGLCNFNRHMDMVLQEMTNERQIKLTDIENRIEVRDDICQNLNIPIGRKGSNIGEIGLEQSLLDEFSGVDVANIRLSINPENFTKSDTLQLRYTKTKTK